MCKHILAHGAKWLIRSLKMTKSPKKYAKHQQIYLIETKMAKKRGIKRYKGGKHTKFLYSDIHSFLQLCPNLYIWYAFRALIGGIDISSSASAVHQKQVMLGCWARINLSILRGDGSRRRSRLKTGGKWQLKCLPCWQRSLEKENKTSLTDCEAVTAPPWICHLYSHIRCRQILLMRFLQPIFITGCWFVFKSVCIGPALRSVHLFLSVKVSESNSVTHSEPLPPHPGSGPLIEPRAAQDRSRFCCISCHFLPVCLQDHELIQTSHFAKLSQSSAVRTSEKHKPPGCEARSQSPACSSTKSS